MRRLRHLFQRSATVAVLAAVFLPLPDNLRADEYGVRTEDTLLRIRTTDNRVFIDHLSSGQGTSWISAPSELRLIDNDIADNTPRAIAWQLDGVESQSDEQGIQVRISLRGRDSTLRVRSTWKARAGPGPIEHTLAVTNNGKSPMLIPWAPSLALTLHPVRLTELTHWWVEKGAGKPGPKGIHVEKILDGFAYQGVSTPYSKAETEPIPWQCIHDPSVPHGLYTGIESSGCVSQMAILTAGESPSLQLSLGIDQTGDPFLAVLQPGETYVFPTAFIGCYEGDVDKGCNRLHRWVERWLLPQTNEPRCPLLTCNTWGSGTGIDEQLAIKMIDECADLGIEMFHVDAGWYKQIGWWHEDPAKFPNGLKPIADQAHQKGLKFGLWVAWTQGGHTAKDRQALSVFEPAMREWFRFDLAEDWRSSRWRGEPVCLASREAQEWCRAELRRIIREYDLDMLEHDQKMVVWDCARDAHGHTASSGDISHRATLGYYGVYDSLRDEFPNVLFENCVSGGRMVDFGVLQRCHYTCATDSYDPLSLRQAFYDASYPLPPRVIEAYVADHSGPTLDTFRYMLRSGMMGWCTLMLDTSKWSRQQREAGKREFELYKRHIRPQIRDGNIYHVLPRASENGWDGIQYHTPRTDSGILFVFRAKSDQDRVVVRLKGLKADMSYRLCCADESSPPRVAHGRDLMLEGLPLTLGSPQSSKIILISPAFALETGESGQD
ncbi:MAG TPA: alpha-galactosidase [Phycisphaerae bacterium]|nr:alpha-galactosidase [Phycisphaerae bacterium]